METTTHRNGLAERTGVQEMRELIVRRLEGHSSSSWCASTENGNKHINCPLCKCASELCMKCPPHCMHACSPIFVCLFWPSQQQSENCLFVLSNNKLFSEKVANRVAGNPAEAFLHRGTHTRALVHVKSKSIELFREQLPKCTTQNSSKRQHAPNVGPTHKADTPVSVANVWTKQTEGTEEKNKIETKAKCKETRAKKCGEGKREDRKPNASFFAHRMHFRVFIAFYYILSLEFFVAHNSFIRLRLPLLFVSFVLKGSGRFRPLHFVCVCVCHDAIRFQADNEIGHHIGFWTTERLASCKWRRAKVIKRNSEPFLYRSKQMRLQFDGGICGCEPLFGKKKTCNVQYSFSR